jgi:hypothetical protein
MWFVPHHDIIYFTLEIEMEMEMEMELQLVQVSGNEIYWQFSHLVYRCQLVWSFICFTAVKTF